MKERIASIFLFPDLGKILSSVERLYDGYFEGRSGQCFEGRDYGVAIVFHRCMEKRVCQNGYSLILNTPRPWPSRRWE